MALLNAATTIYRYHIHIYVPANIDRHILYMHSDLTSIYPRLGNAIYSIYCWSESIFTHFISYTMANTINVDVAIIWSGPAGLTTAFGLHYTGQKVLLIEKDANNIWWDCTNTWCVPSKALIHYANSHGTDGNIQDAMKYVRNKRQHFRDEESVEAFKKEHDLDMLIWTARFSNEDDHILEVETSSWTQLVQAKKILICTWSHAYVPDIPLLDRSEIHTNEGIFEITDDIQDLTIIWGGYIWCELAEAFARVGVQVTLIQRNKNLIPREEPEASAAMLALLQSVWVNVYLNATTSGTKDNTLLITNKITKEETPLKYSHILIATGRRPNVSKLNLEATDIIWSDKGIDVDDKNKTNVKHIYALGDCVAGNPNFTHRADHEWRVLVRNMFLKRLPGMSRNDNIALPTVVYTSSEVARVGMTTSELEKYYTPEEYRTYTVYTKDNDRHFIDDEMNGFVKVHFTRWSGKVLWATMMMKGAGEIIHFFSLAMQQGISAHKLMRQIYAYPTHISILKKVVRPFVTDFYKNLKSEILFRLRDNSFKIFAILGRGALIWAYIWYKKSTGLSNNDLASQIVTFLSWSSLWALFFMMWYSVRWLIFFPAVIYTLLWWILFWPIYGIIYTLIWETASAMFSRAIGAKLWKTMIKPHNQWIFMRLSKLVEKQDFLNLLLLRMVPMNFDIVNYFCGILQVKWKPYFWGTLLGIIPAMTAVVLAWASVDISQWFNFESFSLNTTYLTIAIILYVVSLVIALVAKRMVKK